MFHTTEVCSEDSNPRDKLLVAVDNQNPATVVKVMSHTEAIKIGDDLSKSQKIGSQMTSL
jgi:hypothetical protein